MARSIVVWSDEPGLRSELVSEARRVADTIGGDVAVTALLEGDEAESAPMAAAGADVAYSVEAESLDGESWVRCLAEVVSQADGDALVLVGATKAGMDIASQLAERLSANYAPWAVSFTVDASTGATTATCMIYAGVGLATYRFKPGISILTSAAGVYEVAELQGRTVRRESMPVHAADSRCSVVSVEPKEISGERLGDAKTVVDVGQGVKDRDDLEMVRGFAEQIGAQLACSRPISSTRGWFPEWLGLSGAKIRPELCVMLGISGAIQHMIGVRDSRVIVSVNNDENAAIFLQADIGVIADLHAFVPVLMERMQSRRIGLAY